MSIPLLKTISVTAAILAAAVFVTAPNGAQAGTKHNPNITQSKSELKAKCGRAGGEFTEESNGVYRCVTSGSDTFTVVECKDGKCDGYTFDMDRRTDRRNRFGTRQVAAPNAMAPAIIAPNTIVAPNNFTQRLRKR